MSRLWYHPDLSRGDVTLWSDAGLIRGLIRYHDFTNPLEFGVSGVRQAQANVRVLKAEIRRRMK